MNSETSIDPYTHLLVHCGAIKQGECLLIIYDETTKILIRGFLDAANQLGVQTEIIGVPVAIFHGVEPENSIAQSMLKADLVIALTLKSLAHTRARQLLNARGRRFLSLPGYSQDIINHPAVRVNFHEQFLRTRFFSETFSDGEIIRVITASGTDITLNIAGRVGNCCPGFVNKEYLLGSPPDIEANVSPVEDFSCGIVVVDGSVACAELGLLNSQIVLHVKEGLVVRFESENKEYVKICEDLFDRVANPLAYVLAECGVGLNPAATLTGNMLTDEGVLGCVHFGFGSNATVGGKNDVPFHLDFIFREASLWVDNVQLLRDGKSLI